MPDRFTKRSSGSGRSFLRTVILVRKGCDVSTFVGVCTRKRVARKLTKLGLILVMNFCYCVIVLALPC